VEAEAVAPALGLAVYLHDQEAREAESDVRCVPSLCAFHVGEPAVLFDIVLSSRARATQRRLAMPRVHA
jgi:hypothetical protein